MRCLFACLIALLCLPAAVSARPGPAADPPRLGADRIVGGPALPGAKAGRDTLLLLGPHGSGAAAVGSFQTATGEADWNGWTSVDDTGSGPSYWHVDTFHAVSGTYSAWCGDPGIPSCGQPWDEPGGYGNGWEQYLEWRGTVADNSLPCTVTVSALASYDTEPGYDFCRVSVHKQGQVFVDLWTDDGRAEAVPIGGATVYTPADYLGAGADEVRVVFRFRSDGAFSAEDCMWPNEGAIQLDDVVITLSNGAGYAHDFEDGTLGELAVAHRQGVGDFAQLWTGLQDLDPCRQNSSPQVAFIDDGQVVPGTGGSRCISWCYAYGGYVVNSTGGVAESGFPYSSVSLEHHLENAVVSPPLAWGDAAHDGALLSFDVYRHEELIEGASPGIFYTWSVRSVDTGDPADLARARWRDGLFLHYGGPQYLRQVEDVGELLVPGRTHVQVRLSAREWGWYWGYDGNDASPGPYFDNVRLATFPAGGPALSAAARDLAADAFPAGGEVDLVALGLNNVPFDASGPGPAPGVAPDSLVVTCVPLGAGAALTGPPQLHYRLLRNPLFDPWRSAGLPDQGSVACAPTYGQDKWAVDLPDEGFLFPGDKLHYFFTATQDAGGVTGTAIMPADTAGFGDFSDYPVFNGGYDDAFTVRALPRVRESSYTPGLLFVASVLLWHDSGTDADWDVWTRVLHTSTLLWNGNEPDVFHTQAAAARLPNGLGARATLDQLAVYETIFYTSGEMSAGTLDAAAATGDPRSPDVELLDAWLRLGNRELLAYGNDLASDLAAGSPAQVAFLGAWLGCTVDGRDVRPLIGGQTTPRVLAEVGNPVFLSVDSWLAYGGGCSSEPVVSGYSTLVRDRFDAVVAAPGAMRLAQWANPAGAPGGYPQAAALLNVVPAHAAKVILVPVDLPLIRDDPDAWGIGIPARDLMFWDFVAYFSIPGHVVEIVPVPHGADLEAAAWPNPFNPRTTIRWTAPAAGHLKLRVFDLRGRQVRSLHDGPAAAAGEAVWDGARDDGSAAASGVYFYELRLGGDVRVGRMALVR